MKAIRNSVKAIIIKNGKLLAIKMEDEKGFWYILPGGGQDHEETMEEALKRECYEEIGSSIKVNDLILVKEYIGEDHEIAKNQKGTHQIEFMFECELKEGETPGNGSSPDKEQIGIEWLGIDKITDYRLYPMSMRETFVSQVRGKIYYGALN